MRRPKHPPRNCCQVLMDTWNKSSNMSFEEFLNIAIHDIGASLECLSWRESEKGLSEIIEIKFVDNSGLKITIFTDSKTKQVATHYKPIEW